MYHLYKYVPQCKKCGSWRTGLYIHGLVEDSFIIKLMLKLGLYVMTNPDKDYKNCFCGNCGVSWHEDDLPLKILNKAAYQEQLELRGIKNALHNVKELYKEDNIKVQAEKKRLKKEKKLYRKIYRRFTNKNRKDKI